jgi:charged multivesicular body protein 7
LESNIAHLEDRARAALSAKNTSTARAALRRKKMLSDTLERLRDQAHGVETTLQKIDMAADQVAMVRAMEASTAVLKGLHAQIGGVEGAERVTEALAEQMLITDEIDAVINEPAAGAIDETEVEDEFEALVREEQEKVDREDRARKAAAEEKEQREKDEETRRKLKDLDEFEQKMRADKEAAGKDPDTEAARKALEGMSL